MVAATMPNRDTEIRSEFLRRLAERHGAHAALAVLHQRARQAESAIRAARIPEPERTALLGHMAGIDAAAAAVAGRIAQE